MLIRKAPEFRYSQITPKEAYLNRRKFLGAGAAAIGLLATSRSILAGDKLSGISKSPLSSSETTSPFFAFTPLFHSLNYWSFKLAPGSAPNNFPASVEMQ